MSDEEELCRVGPTTTDVASVVCTSTIQPGIFDTYLFCTALDVMPERLSKVPGSPQETALAR